MQDFNKELFKKGTFQDLKGQGKTKFKNNIFLKDLHEIATETYSRLQINQPITMRKKDDFQERNRFADLKVIEPLEIFRKNDESCLKHSPEDASNGFTEQ